MAQGCTAARLEALTEVPPGHMKDTSALQTQRCLTSELGYSQEAQRAASLWSSGEQDAAELPSREGKAAGLHSRHKAGPGELAWEKSCELPQLDGCRRCGLSWRQISGL